MLAVAFLFPPILYAAGAAAAPVIIHLIMRTKPRKIVFPALRFVRKTHRANLSKLRLKHLLLLAMRMLAIALLALLIARAELPQWTSVADTNVPAAVVFVVDNSGSMGYVHRGQTVLDRGKRLAQQVMETMPPGSRMAVLATESAGEKLAFQADHRFLADQLAAVGPTFGSRTVGAGLTRALAMLAKIDMPRKEVFVVSDMTAQSWRDLKPLAAKDVHFVVLNCGPGEDANIALGDLRLDGSCVPEGAEVTVETILRSAQIGGEVDVRVELDGQPAANQAVVLQPGAATPVSLSFTPHQRGCVHGRVFFQQADPLAMDNVRYFTLEVTPPAGALMVRDPATVGRGDPTGFLLGNAIVPAAAGAGQASWICRETITSDRLDAAQLANSRIVVLGDVSSLLDSQWKDLEKFLRDGGSVWVVVGSLLSPASYNSPAAQAILPAAVGELETLPKRVGWQPPRQSEPMLLPFVGDANPPLTEVRCDRRFRLTSQAGDAHAVLRYADDKPAILTRTVGAGTVVLWNFSPVRDFSNLAGLAQFPILAQRTARLLGGTATADLHYVWGQTAVVPIPKSMDSAVMTVRRPSAPAEEPIVRNLSERALSLPCDRLGDWTVQFAQGAQRVVRGFSVNADFEESDLTRATPQNLQRIMPAEHLVIATDLNDLVERRKTVTQPLDLAIPLLLGLLALMIGESYFANRFYRQDDVQQQPAK